MLYLTDINYLDYSPVLCWS